MSRPTKYEPPEKTIALETFKWLHRLNDDFHYELKNADMGGVRCGGTKQYSILVSDCIISNTVMSALQQTTYLNIEFNSNLDVYLSAAPYHNLGKKLDLEWDNPNIDTPKEIAKFAIEALNKMLQNIKKDAITRMKFLQDIVDHIE